jgi:hypothetical protein
MDHLTPPYYRKHNHDELDCRAIHGPHGSIHDILSIDSHLRRHLATVWQGECVH